MKSMLFAIRHLRVLLALFVVAISSNSYANSEFPGRAVYPNVPVISTQELFKRLDDVIVVDARTPYEYETLRIKGAINIPLKLNNQKFISKILQLRANSDKPIVFYCNGHSCMKSYKAARAAIVIGKLNGIFAYDAGIFDWTNEYPEHAELLGKSPVLADSLISRDDFTRHMLPAVDFIKRADDNVVILDIRDRVQRDGFYIFSGHENSIPLNDKKRLESVIQKAKQQNKPLYIYDAVGKQVRWLQYYLKSQQVTQYYFMEGGAQAFFEVPIHELMDS